MTDHYTQKDEAASIAEIRLMKVKIFALYAVLQLIFLVLISLVPFIYDGVIMLAGWAIFTLGYIKFVSPLNHQRSFEIPLMGIFVITLPLYMHSIPPMFKSILEWVGLS